MNWFDALQEVLENQNVVDGLFSVVDTRLGRDYDELLIEISIKLMDVTPESIHS